MRRVVAKIALLRVKTNKIGDPKMTEKEAREVAHLLKESFSQRAIRGERIIVFSPQVADRPYRYEDREKIGVVVISKDFGEKDRFQRAAIVGRVNKEVAERLLTPFELIGVSPQEWNEKDSPIAKFVRKGKVLWDE